MKIFMMALLLVTIAVPAYAEDNPLDKFWAENKDRISAEVLLGKTKQEVSCPSCREPIDPEDATSFGIRGAYNYNENMAFELGYQNYGKAAYHDEDLPSSSFDTFDTWDGNIKTTAINIGVKGIYPLDKEISLVGRLGLSKWDLEGETRYSFESLDTVTSGSDKDNFDGTDPYYGIGAEYNYSKVYFLLLSTVF